MNSSTLPLLLVVALASLSAGCAAEEETAEGDSAITLTPKECGKPDVRSSPRFDANKRPIAGTARATLRGCILAKPGESGSKLLTRAVNLISDSGRFAMLRDAQGAQVFSE